MGDTPTVACRLRSRRARFIILYVPAGLFLSPQSGKHLGIGAARTATHRNGLSRAVALASPALHAGSGPDELSHPLILNEYPVGADHTAHPAAIAQVRIIAERVGDISTFHHLTPKWRRTIMRTMPRMLPPNIQAITGK